jgi:hypothetical protein
MDDEGPIDSLNHAHNLHTQTQHTSRKFNSSNQGVPFKELRLQHTLESGQILHGRTVVKWAQPVG